MANPMKRQRAPIITVMQKYSCGERRCWFYVGGKPISIPPEVADIEARKGLITLRTITR